MSVSLTPGQITLPPDVMREYQAMGLDPNMMTTVLNKVTPNPVTGLIGPDDVMRYMMTHAFEDPMIQQLGAASLAFTKKNAEGFDADFSSFDFNALVETIPDRVEDGWWHITLEKLGYVDADGNYITEDAARTTPGAKPKFFLNCEYSSIIRLIQEVVGLPDSLTVLRFIKKAMASPLPGNKPALPRLLHIQIKLQQHRPVLQPFLDSLPEPFTWDVETPAIAQGINEIIDARMQERYRQHMEFAETSKVAGNEAFKAKDRAKALAGYAGAIDMLVAALSSQPTDDQRNVANKLMAICLSNRAATYLLEGEGYDVAKALEDSKKAERYDADYGKGYYRQAKAYEALADLNNAQEVLRRALARPSLATDGALLKLLNELDVQFD